MPFADWSRTQLDAIKRGNDLVAVVRGHGIALRRRGRSYFGRCPFHAEQVPSFAVSREAGLYHCFGCGAGGDAIRFIERVEQVSFREAVRRLAERAGLAIDELCDDSSSPAAAPTRRPR
jgi:DNA primase